MSRPTIKRPRRLVRCSGKIVRGAWKGQRCMRTKRLDVDKHENTRIWKCVSHEGQR